MAEIPVKKKASAAPWLLLGGVAALALVTVLALADDDETTVAELENTDTVAITETDDAATGYASADQIGGDMTADAETPIRLIATLEQTPLDASLNQSVDLDNVMVEQVLGDRTFMVSNEDDQQVLVVLDEVRTPGTPIEGRYDIDQGDMIDLEGTVRAMTESIDGQRIEDAPADAEYFVWASTVTIQETS